MLVALNPLEPSLPVQLKFVPSVRSKVALPPVITEVWPVTVIDAPAITLISTVEVAVCVVEFPITPSLTSIEIVSVTCIVLLTLLGGAIKVGLNEVGFEKY